jgi:hypothetical protein
MPMSDVPDRGVLHGTEFASDPVSTEAVNEIPVGDRTLYAVSDGFLVMSERFLGTAEHPAAAYETLSAVYGKPRLPLGCFFLPGEQNVLIDTGVGPVDMAGRGTLIGGNWKGAGRSRCSTPTPTSPRASGDCRPRGTRQATRST